MPKRTISSQNGTPRDRSYSPRRLNTREPKQRFLIVCEGTKTEPNYFKGFRVPTAIIKVQGVGEDPNRLVKSAKDLAAKDEYNDLAICIGDDILVAPVFKLWFFVVSGASQRCLIL